MGPDWRLGYLLAAATQDIYLGKAKDAIPKATRRQLEQDFTDSPIPGPVRGHIFGWRLNESAGDESYWENHTITQQTADLVSIKGNIDSWPNNPNGLIEAANSIASSANVDWRDLEQHTTTEKILELLLAIEILYGERSKQIIPNDVKSRIAGKFSESR